MAENNNTQEMSEAAIEARRAYKRAWNKANPDKVKAAQIRHWEKVAAEAAAAEADAGADAQEVQK